METISNLVSSAMSLLAENNYPEDTISGYFSSYFKPILDRYEEEKILLYSDDFMNVLERDFNTEYEEGKISRQTKNKRLRGIGIIREINNTGSFIWKVFHKTVIPIISSEFENSIANYLKTRKLCESNIKFERSTLRQFAKHIQSEGIESPSLITSEALVNFIKYKSLDCHNSLDKITTALSKYVQYLYTEGIHSEDLSGIIRMPRSRYHYIQNAISTEELSLVISQIDKNTPIGKRDFAILSLAITTGIRAGDIVSLELSDIDWKNKELSVVQGKTKKLLKLPLQENVCDILADYILNVRPKTESSKVFVRSAAPFVGFKNGIAIGSLFRRYLSKAGIVHTLHDGKTFHGIRRMIGTNMVADSIPITTVAQVLGHQSIRPTRQYISINLHGLKRCALPMSSLGENS